MENMIYIEGGVFMMGDVFGEGQEDEQPVHQVTLDGFYLAKYPVTIAQFRQFVEETGYRTSAEGPDEPPGEREKLMTRYMSSECTEEEKLELHERYLAYGGAGYWDADKRKWSGYNPHTTWKNPGIEQTDADPVMAISPVDAMEFCNWLSKQEGIPIACVKRTGQICVILYEGNHSDSMLGVPCRNL